MTTCSCTGRKFALSAPFINDCSRSQMTRARTRPVHEWNRAGVNAPDEPEHKKKVCYACVEVSGAGYSGCGYTPSAVCTMVYRAGVTVVLW